MVWKVFEKTLTCWNLEGSKWDMKEMDWENLKTKISIFPITLSFNVSFTTNFYFQSKKVVNEWRFWGFKFTNVYKIEAIFRSLRGKNADVFRLKLIIDELSRLGEILLISLRP